MKLYLVRHGEAEMIIDDNLRKLTINGIKEVETVAFNLKEKKVKVDSIFHSGKKRAEQTAEIISKNIETKNDIEFLTGITPNDPVESIILFVTQSKTDIMLVGHLPFMNIIAAQLTGLEYSDPNIQFPTATVLCLNKVDNNWKYNWRITP